MSTNNMSIPLWGQVRAVMEPLRAEGIHLALGRNRRGFYQGCRTGNRGRSHRCGCSRLAGISEAGAMKRFLGALATWFAVNIFWGGACAAHFLPSMRKGGDEAVVNVPPMMGRSLFPGLLLQARAGSWSPRFEINR